MMLPLTVCRLRQFLKKHNSKPSPSSSFDSNFRDRIEFDAGLWRSILVPDGDVSGLLGLWGKDGKICFLISVLTLYVSDGLPPVTSLETERKDRKLWEELQDGRDQTQLDNCDVEGVHVNGRNNLLVLKEALRCDRSKNYRLVVESCRLYSKVHNEIKEEKIRYENMLETLVNTLCLLVAIFKSLVDP
ncbi:hypothetical protein L2E82_48433 [Cichorium intybus]|uniref:Uncharacterized protein n=1 Tax=Cichorium intybus TaxID=13427 RepID=A0ACB8YZ73_CICIN|nr:hypothetical protein L2E82_48433 [Cichorium intybus]